MKRAHHRARPRAGRRRIRRASAAAALALSAALPGAVLLGGCGPPPGPERSPNVLLLTCDTLRADHLSAYGYDRPTTPNLQRLASRGTLYERAFAPAPWTLPSMAMLMTGHVRSDNSGDLAGAEPTLAEQFEAAGFATYGVSANPLLFENKGWKRGFRDMLVRGESPELAGSELWMAERLVNRALKRLQMWQELGDQRPPFFLFAFFFDPHDPYLPTGPPAFQPRVDADRRARMTEALPATERALLTDAVYAEIEQLIAHYDSEIKEVDAAIGRLLMRLQSMGEFERTVIAFTADHGEGLWQRARPADEPPKDRAFFPPLYYGHGLTLHEEQLHVPLILFGPGVPAGERRTEAVSLLDLAPTLLGLAGCEVFGEPDGVDLFAHAPLAEREVLPAFNLRASGLRYRDRYKLHVPRPHLAAEGAAPELFDLDADPLELRPIDDPQLLAELQARLAEWSERGLRDDADSTSTIDARLLDELGYTEGETSTIGESAEDAPGLEGGR